MRIKRTIKRVIAGVDRAHEVAKYQDGPPPTASDAPSDSIISADTMRENRIPPGQARTRKWPILDASGPPELDIETWSLTVGGLCESPRSFTLDEFAELPRVRVFADFHCVTRWSRLGNLWEGVSTSVLGALAPPLPEATHVLLHAYDDDWFTNVSVGAFLSDDALIADTHDGMPIALEHGGPVRAIIPLLYGWKSAKWLRGIEYVAEDQPGYWETGGYHMRGDPWLEERFRLLDD